MSSSNDLQFLFKNNDTVDITNIINHLFKKYDEPYNNKETILKDNTNILDFKNIIMELKNVEKKCTKLNDNKITSLFNPSINVKNIYDMNFVDDLDLLERIIEYRKLVIRYIILICNYNIEAYKCLVLKITYLTQLRMDDTKNVDIKDIEYLNELKEKRKFYIVSILNKSSKYYQESICKYIEINNKLQNIKSSI